MKKEKINGISYWNFGSNNYSCEMEAVTFDPHEISPEKVMMLPNFWLHPALEPNEEEIFALKGSMENYFQFCQKVIEQESIKETERKLNVSVFEKDINWDEFKQTKKQFCATFKPWWHKK